MKRFCTTVMCLILIFATDSFAQLETSHDRRHLVNPEGSPFFWLGDTGWALFQKLSREDVEFYFETRAKQGFSVIHAAVYNINPFVLPPLSNAYGDMPFMDDDPRQPATTPGNNFCDAEEYDYWDHVEFVVDAAAQRSLVINMLPIFGVADGDGYNLISPDNAYEYGLFIGDRFKGKTNIIWCLGGDVLADNEIRKSTWNLLAKGITEGVAGSEDYSKTLMTYHVRGGHSSSEYFPDAPWLDFHMLQTWASFTRIYGAVSADYNRKPIKPILHGEGAYEDGPEYPTKPITPHVIRKQMYWAWFAGGFHTYGNSNVWNFGTTPYYVSQDWKTALTSPGAEHLSVARTILESILWWDFVPDSSIILEGRGNGDSLNVAMWSKEKDKLIVYLSHPSSVLIDLRTIKSTTNAMARWIQPQTGELSVAGIYQNKLKQKFTSPEGWQDALLLIQAREASMSLPPDLDRVLRDYETTWRTGDMNALSRLFTTNGLVLSNGHPPVRGRAAIIKHYTGRGGPLSLRAIEYAVDGNLAYIIGGYAGSEREPDRGKFTLTLEKDKNGRWLIVSDMDNSNQKF